MTEILFMVVMPAFFARLGVKWTARLMLAIGLVGAPVRADLCLALQTSTGHLAKWMLAMGGIVLHGICFDLLHRYVAFMIYVDNEADPKIRGQAQNLFNAHHCQGLGIIVGAQVIATSLWRAGRRRSSGDESGTDRDGRACGLFSCVFAVDRACDLLPVL